jgi:hypothetical protein
MLTQQPSVQLQKSTSTGIAATNQESKSKTKNRKVTGITDN